VNFRIGAITAKCPACNGSEFELVATEPAGPHASYACEACGRRIVYSALVMQIGNEALRQSRETLRALQSRR